MKITREFPRCKFDPSLIGDAWSRLVASVKDKHTGSYLDLVVQHKHDRWSVDTAAEFFNLYRETISHARYDSWIFTKPLKGAGFRHTIHKLVVSYSNESGTKVEVESPNRSIILDILNHFEDHVSDSIQPSSGIDRTLIFVGDGHSDQWRDLRDHLQDLHGFNVQAYETGARAGHEIRDILEQLLKSSSFALLVLTGDDTMSDGTSRARENVIHEAGLFQARIGFHRAIILLEDGVPEFSNISGIHQLRFAKGNIREVFGDVVATLRREFEDVGDAVAG